MEMRPSPAECLRTDRSFERIYRRHVGDVYRYSLAVLREPTDAVDVTQVTFLNASTAFARGERPSNSLNWLIAIAHDVCRRRTRHADGQADGPNDWEEDVPTRNDVRRALGRLPFQQRAALVLRELEGRSYAEIAELLGLTRSRAEALLFEARRSLREQLQESITCTQAAKSISRRADTRLPRAERAALRLHLRECDECARFAARDHAQRKAFAALAAAPVPGFLEGGVTLSAAPETPEAQRQAAWRAAKRLSEHLAEARDKPDRKIFPRPASH
jgi:RNA polymerase sigma factor (sigma-70 family)